MLKDMRKTLLTTCMAALFTGPAAAQYTYTAVSPPGYRETAPRINDLVHTRLEVNLDYLRQFLYGKAWITLQPHAYTTDSLLLDAKGMEIKEVSLMKSGKLQKLAYTYDSLQLHIGLGAAYRPGEKYTVYIHYTSRPNLLKAKGSVGITNAKGLYFINPDSSMENKPVQVWTQGETEASSAWFPTIDRPNQKMTTEISLTVPDKYLTLSNGRLVSQRPGASHMRTDTWKMEQPHAPYLVMFTVGSFAVLKDNWRGKEVSYYVEPDQAPYARKIFGHTPEMMTFFSRITGVDYPWNKYAQIVCRDYVSGAMENTTATLHGDFTYQNDRELLDENIAENNIAHELFHQWFGDYVTTESWSNLTVNESFANFSEVLWNEYKYGKDAAGYTNYFNKQLYFNSPEDKNDTLVRFHYEHQEDPIDAVTYQKGGRILNMLRNYLGDTVFYKGLHAYLTRNAFKTGEAHQVRLAMEEASGRDLNWFFNQWYFNSGHPYLTIGYQWDEEKRTQSVYLTQTQPGAAFILPFAVECYVDGKKLRYEVSMRHKADTFCFTLPAKPRLVNVDADKVLLAVKTDHKTPEEWAYQYFHAPLFEDRMDALNDAAGRQQDPAALKVLLAACRDPFFRLRMAAVDSLQLQNPALRAAAVPVLTEMAIRDSATLVRASVLNVLAKLKDPSLPGLFETSLQSPSYNVQAAALNGLLALDTARAYRYALQLEKGAREKLVYAVAAVFCAAGDTAKLDFMQNAIVSDFYGVYRKLRLAEHYMKLLAKVNDTEKFSRYFKTLVPLREIAVMYHVEPRLVQPLETLKSSRKDAGEVAMIDRLISNL